MPWFVGAYQVEWGVKQALNHLKRKLNVISNG